MLVRLINGLDHFTDVVGRTVSWLAVFLVITVLAVVILRYFLQVGSVALQESVTYIHATMFLSGIAYTLRHEGHVRVDIFYRNFSLRRKAMVNLFGGLFFLMPVSWFVAYSSWDYVWASWAIGETSAENNGLPFKFLLKTLILVMSATLMLQGLAEVLKSLLFLIGRSDIDQKEGSKNTSGTHELLH
jgi:TRAP-type mannitol/chloroaromatic compound transport system permease small subunit